MRYSIRETYGLPKRVPVAARVWVFPALVTLVSFGAWLVLPHTPVVAGVLVLIVIGVVGAGVFRIMTSRQLNDLPPRNPAKPPSVGGD